MLRSTINYETTSKTNYKLKFSKEKNINGAQYYFIYNNYYLSLISHNNYAILLNFQAVFRFLLELIKKKKKNYCMNIVRLILYKNFKHSYKNCNYENRKICCYIQTSRVYKKRLISDFQLF